MGAQSRLRGLCFCSCWFLFDSDRLFNCFISDQVVSADFDAILTGVMVFLDIFIIIEGNGFVSDLVDQSIDIEVEIFVKVYGGDLSAIEMKTLVDLILRFFF